VLVLLRRRSVLVSPTIRLAQSRDPADDKFLECAVAGAADYLVTGDEDLLAVGRYQGLAIVTAREFLAILSR
jgi:putative PIN family toxin of toxin-antitoxin system